MAVLRVALVGLLSALLWWAARGEACERCVYDGPSCSRPLIADAPQGRLEPDRPEEGATERPRSRTAAPTASTAARRRARAQGQAVPPTSRWSSLQRRLGPAAIEDRGKPQDARGRIRRFRPTGYLPHLGEEDPLVG